MLSWRPLRSTLAQKWFQFYAFSTAGSVATKIASKYDYQNLPIVEIRFMGRFVLRHHCIVENEMHVTCTKTLEPPNRPFQTTEADDVDQVLLTGSMY